MNLAPLDIAVFIGYCCIIIGAGLWVSRSKDGVEKTSEDYFLASKSLPWWAIGASLIASNISAEQFIGMSGSGFAIGLGIATYEWMAAATLIIVGKFFLPIFLEKEIYTMPQFLEKRYDGRVRTILAVFWIILYILVNLTSVIYLGALTINTIMGVDMTYAILALCIFSLVYSIYGGLTAVAWTDVIQVIFLVLGGLVTTYLALDAVSGGEGVVAGLTEVYKQVPGKFDMILSPDNPFYKDLPGISVLIGGMWIINLNYWGCNQYITQRALAAKSLGEAQKGIIFAGYLKLFMPLIVVIPGIAAYVLNQQDPSISIGKPDEAYPVLLNAFVPVGLKGAALAALAAAIVSSLSSMMNSTATIFTMDIYRNFINKNASEKKLVNIGRLVGVLSITIAGFIAPALGNIDQAFQFIQEYTGLVSPGIFAIFFLGLFWKKTTANAAFWIAVLTFPLSWSILYLFPLVPFIDRMGIVFLLVCAVGVSISLIEHKGQDDPKAVITSRSLFSTGPVFNAGAISILVILTILYVVFW